MIVLATEIRARLWAYTSPKVAKALGLTVADLRAIAAGHHPLSEKQLLVLARIMKLEPEPVA